MKLQNKCAGLNSEYNKYIAKVCWHIFNTLLYLTLNFLQNFANCCLLSSAQLNCLLYVCCLHRLICFGLGYGPNKAAFNELPTSHIICGPKANSVTHTSSHNENAFDRAAWEMERVAKQFQLMLIDFTPTTADSRSQREEGNKSGAPSITMTYVRRLLN